MASPRVEIRPHVGTNLASGRQVDLGQERVYVDGRVIGYLSRRRGPQPRLVLIRTVPAADLVAAVEAVGAAYGSKVRVFGRAPDIPAEFLQEVDEEDDDQDEDE